MAHWAALRIYPRYYSPLLPMHAESSQRAWYLPVSWGPAACGPAPRPMATRMPHWHEYRRITSGYCSLEAQPTYRMTPVPLHCVPVPPALLDEYCEAALLEYATPAVRVCYGAQEGLGQGTGGSHLLPSSMFLNPAAYELFGLSPGDARSLLGSGQEVPWLHHDYVLPRLLVQLAARAQGMLQTSFRGVYLRKHVSPSDPTVVYYSPFAATEVTRYVHARDGCITASTTYFMDVRWPAQGTQAVLSGMDQPMAGAGSGAGSSSSVGNGPAPGDAHGSSGAQAGQPPSSEYRIDMATVRGIGGLLLACPDEVQEARTVLQAEGPDDGAASVGGADGMSSEQQTKPRGHAWPFPVHAVQGSMLSLASSSPSPDDQYGEVMRQVQARAGVAGQGHGGATMGVPASHGGAASAQHSSMTDRIAGLKAVRQWSGLGPSSAVRPISFRGPGRPGSGAPPVNPLGPCCASARLVFSGRGVTLTCPSGLRLRLCCATAPILTWLVLDRYEAALAVDQAAHTALQMASGSTPDQQAGPAKDGTPASWPPRATLRLTTDPTGAALVVLDVPTAGLLRQPARSPPTHVLSWALVSGRPNRPGQLPAGGAFAPRLQSTASVGSGSAVPPIPARGAPPPIPGHALPQPTAGSSVVGMTSLGSLAIRCATVPQVDYTGGGARGGAGAATSGSAFGPPGGRGFNAQPQSLHSASQDDVMTTGHKLRGLSLRAAAGPPVPMSYSLGTFGHPRPAWGMAREAQGQAEDGPGYGSLQDYSGPSTRARAGGGTAVGSSTAAAGFSEDLPSAGLSLSPPVGGLGGTTTLSFLHRGAGTGQGAAGVQHTEALGLDGSDVSPPGMHLLGPPAMPYSGLPYGPPVSGVYSAGSSGAARRMSTGSAAGTYGGVALAAALGGGGQLGGLSPLHLAIGQPPYAGMSDGVAGHPGSGPEAYSGAGQRDLDELSVSSF